MSDTLALRAPPASDARASSSWRSPATSLSVALIGNFPPRRCGIATFTADIAAALGPHVRTRIVAMSDGAETDGYDASVRVVRPDVRGDYAAAADAIAADGVDVVCLQHEYGIFGGDAGEYILELLDRLTCPVVTTLHTVLREPNEDQRRVMGAIVRRSSVLVVMSRFGADTMRDVYRVSADKIVIVPHGAPDRPMIEPDVVKPRLGLQGRRVLLTFGFLSPNKGIETVIESLPALTRDFPDLLYVVLGATHPQLARREGESYLCRLQALARDLGVDGNVRFDHRYTNQDELLDYLAAADIYVTPYRHEAQVTSGTLAYAVALGKPVVSTPYWHARELLQDGVGALVAFDSVPAMTQSLHALLGDDAGRLAMARRAYAAGRATTWPSVGKAYRAALEGAVRSARKAQRRPAAPVATPNLAAVSRMTDDTGIFQHAVGIVADRRHGYCLDDAARALILAHRVYATGARATGARRIAHVCAALIQDAWNPDAEAFRNFMAFDRRWLEPVGSQDSMGRAFWSLGETVRAPVDPALGAWAAKLSERAIPALQRLEALRARAFAVLGATHLAERPSAFRDATLTHIAFIHDALRDARKSGWTWFEPSLSYDNARLPEALLVGAQITGSAQMRADALAALAWLAEVQTGAGGVFLPQGNAGFGERYGAPAPFDQQPVEAAAMADACALAFRMTGDPQWAGETARAYAWFTGANTLGVRMIDDEGGCFDGLHAEGASINQGAESILSAPLAACAVASVYRLPLHAPRA